jgi:ADP-ribose pyrophosphatase YjhB (NUDIX family)
MSEKLRPGIDFIGISTPFYCNDGHGNFVLHKRSNRARDEHGRWDFGSGQLGFLEDTAVSVLREIKEEYGVDGEIQEQVPPHSIVREQDGIMTHWLALPYFVKVDVNKAQIMELDKFTEIGIFTLNNLPQPLHNGVILTMEKYKTIWDKYRG